MPTVKTLSLAATRQQGFTLLELLIASIIFAIMAIMAYGGLDNVIRNSRSSQQALDRLQQLQHSISVVNRDFSQIVKRDVRDEYGNQQSYLSTASNLDNLIEFSRGGRVNPANLLRSSLMRVAYRLDESQLIRLQWNYLDRAPGAEPKQTVLIDKIESITFRYLDNKAEWQEQWPPVSGVTDATGLLAIELVITLKDWGDIRRLYEMN